jgi:hypothetical protein
MNYLTRKKMTSQIRTDPERTRRVMNISLTSATAIIIIKETRKMIALFLIIPTSWSMCLQGTTRLSPRLGTVTILTSLLSPTCPLKRRNPNTSIWSPDWERRIPVGTAGRRIAWTKR